MTDNNRTDDKYQEPANRESQSENTDNEEEEEPAQNCCTSQAGELAQILASAHDPLRDV